MGHTVCDRFHSAVELIGARWNGAILRSLFEGNRRYCDIRTSISGISDTMLAHRLRDLEERGLLQRLVTAGPPTRVEYNPTQMASELRPVLEAISTWSQRWIAEPARSPLDLESPAAALPAGPATAMGNSAHV